MFTSIKIQNLCFKFIETQSTSTIVTRGRAKKDCGDRELNIIFISQFFIGISKGLTLQIATRARTQSSKNPLTRGKVEENVGTYFWPLDVTYVCMGGRVLRGRDEGEY